MMRKREYLKMLVLAILISSFFGMVDYLYSYLQEVPGFKIGLLYYMYQGLFWGQLVYVVAGFIFGILFLLAAGLWRFIFPKFFQDRRDVFGMELGILAGLFVFLLLTAISPNAGKWRLFVNFCLFSVLAIFAGSGVKVFWSRYLEDWFGGPVKGALILSQALLLATMLILLWILKFPTYDRAKVCMSALATGWFLAAVFLARFCLQKKSAWRITGYAAFALLSLSLPIYGYRKVPPMPALGKPRNSLNIIWIISDACRFDNLGIYSSGNQTPNLDQLGREGIVFKNAYSNAAWTVPSMYSMTSSLYPSIFQTYAQASMLYGAGQKVEFFPKRLHGYGYHTRAVVANLFANPDIAFQGFERSQNFYSRYRLQRLGHYRVILKIHYLIRRFLGLSQVPDTTRMVTEQAEQFVQETPEPFFLWLHYMNPHIPYNPPPEYLQGIKYNGLLRPPFNVNDPFHLSEDKSHPQEEVVKLGIYLLSQEDKRYIRELNLGNFRYLDRKIGELMKTIREQGLEKNTVVIFTADHGEEFWEHEQWAHGHSLYDELLHIPLIIWGAGLKPKEIEEPVAMIDLVPTLAEMIGIEPNPVWQGRSFYPALASDSFAIKVEPIFAEGTIRPEEMKSIRTREYKLIIGTLSGKHLLFSLKTDPGEQENIYAENPLVAEELEEQLNLWQAQNQVLRSKLRVRGMTLEERKEFEDRLRAAGYIK